MVCGDYCRHVRRSEKRRIRVGIPYSREAPTFWEHEGNSAVRWGNHKLLHLHGEPWELYDMDVDRTELNNLIGANTPLEAELLRGYEGCPKQPG